MHEPLRRKPPQQPLNDPLLEVQVNDVDNIEVKLRNLEYDLTRAVKRVAYGFQTLEAVFAKLDKPVDFEALDGEPVDLVFALIAPESAGADHLKALARVARVLRDGAVTQKLRAAQDADAIYAVLMEAPTTSHAA